MATPVVPDSDPVPMVGPGAFVVPDPDPVSTVGRGVRLAGLRSGTHGGAGGGCNNHPHPTGTHPAILATHPLDVPAFPHHHPPTVDTGFRRQDEEGGGPRSESGKTR